MSPKKLTEGQHKARAMGYGLELRRKRQEKIADADARGSDWLARGNEAAESGKKALAEKCYDKAQFWLDRSNKLRGNF